MINEIRQHQFNYLLIEKVVNPNHSEKGGMTDGFAIGGVQKRTKAIANNASSNLSVSSSTSSHSNAPKAISYEQDAAASPLLHTAAKSFVLNEDMLKIRQAEQVILTEEDRFSVFCRDPEGRLMPELQVRAYKDSTSSRYETSTVYIYSFT